MILIMLVVAVVVVIVGSITLFVQKIVLKSRMRRGLGRKVEERELTSINAWMQASSPTENASPTTGNQTIDIAQSLPKSSNSPTADQINAEPASLKNFASHAPQRTASNASFRVAYELA